MPYLSEIVKDVYVPAKAKYLKIIMQKTSKRLKVKTPHMTSIVLTITSSRT